MIGKEGNEFLQNVVFSVLSFLLTPLPYFCSGVPVIMVPASRHLCLRSEMMNGLKISCDVEYNI